MASSSDLLKPPAYCAYAAGPCDQDFSAIEKVEGLFLFASKPPEIAATIEAAVDELKTGEGAWATWRDMDLVGQMVFCEICKRMRGAATVYADVTTLNFNLLFEIGFAIGLGLAVRPIRDSSFIRDRRAFDALGVLDTFGYLDFRNAGELANFVRATGAGRPLGPLVRREYRETPVYLLKGPLDTDGVVKLLSVLKKSRVRFRTHDPSEIPRLSLHKAREQVAGSFGVVAHLLGPERDGSHVHNALSAFVCGIAVAEEKPVLMLREGEATEPIDYRDLVQPYAAVSAIEHHMAEFLPQVVDRMQQAVRGPAARPEGLLSELDMGDVAAENEIGGLRDYFVRTGRFDQVRKGHAQLVIGRKGAGKSAMFYGLRDAISRGREVLILDMKPEGHQFTRLREAVLKELTVGQQEYVMAAFWAYLLSAEVAHKLLSSQRERRDAERDPKTFESYRRLEAAYRAHDLESTDDLPQRFLRQVDRIASRLRDAGKISDRDDLAEILFGGDVSTLNAAVAEYVTREKDEVWLLLDNLDKSWATRGSTEEDILILRGLLDATAQLQRSLEARDVVFHGVVFLRTDVYERLQGLTPDRGKDSITRLDWDDPEVFREIVRRRVVASVELTGGFDAVWVQLAPPLVGVEDSFQYTLDRTLGRPRDLLQFISAAIQVAVDRGHEKIEVDDLLQGEREYSEDMLIALVYEIEDTHPELSEALYGFQGVTTTLTKAEVAEILLASGVAATGLDEALELLLWYGFLGVAGAGEAADQFAYNMRYNIPRLVHLVDSGGHSLVVHPAFRMALAVGST